MEDNNINQENMDQNTNPNLNQNSEQNSEKLQEISKIYNPQTTNGGKNVVLVKKSPIEYYIQAFQKYGQFSGRATRAEYWWFYLGTTVVLFLLGILDQVLSVPFVYIYVFASFIPALAVTARRLHDVGKSGWLQLLGIIASIVISISALLSLFLGFTGGVILFSGNSSEIGSGILGIAVILAVLSLISIGVIIWLFILYITNSTPGSNKYGPNPKGIES
jgi:uncharacterized membrane protein YhaH (DUF805 family)